MQARKKNLIGPAMPVWLLALILFTAGCSTANPAETDRRISLFDGRVSFIPPDGFKPVKQEQLKMKLAENDPPKHIFANESQSAVVMIYAGDHDLEPHQLIEIKRFVEGMHRNYSGWITSEIIEMNGRQWFHFDSEDPVIDGPLATLVAPTEDGAEPEVLEEKRKRHRAYTTVFNGKNLGFAFESEIDEYPQFKDAFNKSIQTIQVRD